MIAHRIDLLTLHEMVIASAVPNPMPAVAAVVPCARGDYTPFARSASCLPIRDLGFAGVWAETGNKDSGTNRGVRLSVLTLAAALPRGPPTCRRPNPAASARPPNIVIIFADDLGYGDLGVYGHPLIKTPRLDRLSSEGLKLTSFYASAPVCSASRYSLLTGRYAIRAGINGALMPESKRAWCRETTIADVLKSAGYRTGMVGKWHLGNRRLLPDRAASTRTRPALQQRHGPALGPDRRAHAPTKIAQELPGEVDNATLTERYTEELLRSSGRTRTGPSSSTSRTRCPCRSACRRGSQAGRRAAWRRDRDDRLEHRPEARRAADAGVGGTRCHLHQR
jgi:hypothetical protein